MAEIHLFDKETDFKTFHSGDLVFQEGEPSDFMYVVIEGEVEVYIHEKLLHPVHAGGIVGEMSLIDPQPRSGTVKAKTDCKLVPVDQKRFKFLVQQHPYFALEVMKILVERLREATDLGVKYL